MKEINHYTVSSTSETRIFHCKNWEELMSHSTLNYSQTIWVLDSRLKVFLPMFEHIEHIEIDGGEEVKSVSQWLYLLERFADYQADRKTQVIAIGGGSVSDLVGFAAAVYARGVAFSIVPSTLLSLIDASIGGKTGINFLGKKNQIGVLKQPAAIYSLPSLLEHLPQENMADGFAEIIKYGLIIDATLLGTLSSTQLDEVCENKALLEEIINTCIIHKSRVVMKDPFEEGQRRILNFGHTIGHAIESLYGLSHGKAVAIGMYFAVKLSAYRNPALVPFVHQFSELLTKYNLPYKLKAFSSELLFEKIKADKKRENRSIHFVFLKSIGEAIVEVIPMSELKLYLDKAEQEKWML